MKRLGMLLLLAGLLVWTLPSTSGWSFLHEKNTATRWPTAVAHQAALNDLEETQQPEIKTFTGRIAKYGPKFVLEDSSMRASFQLDDQQKAEKYQGKNVRITGTLDAENNIIHVQTIEEAV
jgi:uncharacterized protein DUF5818